MATPITHLYFSQEIYKKIFSDLSEQDIYLGTSFPDIRHLMNATREKTHYLPNFADKKDAFQIGIDLHNWLDEARASYRAFFITEEFQTEVPIFLLKNNTGMLAVRFFEDECFIKKLYDENRISESFGRKPQNKELAFEFPEEKIILWHSIIRDYIGKVGSLDCNSYFKLLQSPVSDEEKKEIISLIFEMRKNASYRKFIENMIEYLIISFCIEYKHGILSQSKPPYITKKVKEKGKNNFY